MIHESCAEGWGLLPDRLPLWETLFWEYMLDSAENCMLSVWQLSCFTFSLFRQKPSEEYFCNESVVSDKEQLAMRAARGIQREALTMSLSVLTLSLKVERGPWQFDRYLCVPCLILKGFFDRVLLLPPGFKVGRGDCSGHESPPAVLKPWQCPGEQVGSALWSKPSRGHCVT